MNAFEKAIARIEEEETKELADYVATYLEEEIERGNFDDLRWLVWNAINAYIGGAR
jgi:hypothetical protein